MRNHTGENESVIIAGFALSGAGSRPLLIRAVGPTLRLAPFNVGGALADPGLRLFRENSLLLSNDDWSATNGLESTAARLGAFPLAVGSHDAALTSNLGQGLYSVVGHGQAGATGEAVLEVYDALEGSGPAPAISNLSMRAALQPNGTMIAGFVIRGTGPKQLLLRAIGPTLGSFGIANPLANPRMHLFAGNNDVGSNDDWSAAANASQVAAIAQQLGAFALTSGARDAAMFVSLNPGAYTLHVTSEVSGDQGIALVELYDADAVPGVPPVTPTPDIWPVDTPLGALPPAVPIWTKTLTNGPSTFVQSTNSWLDDFDHGLSNAEMGLGYRVFELASGTSSLLRTKHFRHNNHWMVDVAGHAQNGSPPWNHGGAMMRPDRTFRFEDGHLIIEADVAAGIKGYAGNAWPELDISTAPAPTGVVVDNGYAYGQFGGAWALGIRLQAEQRVPIAALYRPDGIRTFEISFFQSAGAQVFGGGPWGAADAAWRVCDGNDPDINCRDRFRWEITRDTLTLYVNGVKYMEHRGLPPEKQIPDAVMNSDIYVYFSDWVYLPQADTVRFHWDRLAINPAGAPTSASAAMAGAKSLELCGPAALSQ